MDVLIYADTVRSASLRHEVPATVTDPFLYGEREGRPFAVVSQLDADSVGEARPGIELLSPEELGLDELLASGLGREEALLELALRACGRLGVERAAVPPDFPLVLADRLRAAGVELEVARGGFVDRRRAKSPSQLDGIRRAQRAAEAGMTVAADLLRSAESDGDTLRAGGQALTCERIKAAVEAEVIRCGAVLGEMIVAHGPQGATGHDMGSGPIAAGEPVVVDLWPQDKASSYYADMTRTFTVGTPSAELTDWRARTLEALERSVAAISPGVPASSVYEIACKAFQAHGYPTQLSKSPGEVLRDGFFWGLGHGVGLEVHEAPSLGRADRDPLVAGDVLAVEPGLCRAGVGAYRVEDLVLVTADGAETLTRFHYELEP